MHGLARGASGPVAAVSVSTLREVHAGAGRVKVRTDKRIAVRLAGCPDPNKSSCCPVGARRLGEMAEMDTVYWWRCGSGQTEVKQERGVWGCTDREKSFGGKRKNGREKGKN